MPVTRNKLSMLVFLIHVNVTFSSSLITLLHPSETSDKSSPRLIGSFLCCPYPSLTGVVSFLTLPCALILLSLVHAVPSIWNTIPGPLCLLWPSLTLITHREMCPPHPAPLCAFTIQASGLAIFQTAYDAAPGQHLPVLRP